MSHEEPETDETMADYYNSTMAFDRSDEPDEWQEEWAPTTVTCKFCGKPFLEWKTIDGRWRLFEKDATSPHACPQYRPPESPQETPP